MFEGRLTGTKRLVLFEKSEDILWDLRWHGDLKFSCNYSPKPGELTLVTVTLKAPPVED